MVGPKYNSFYSFTTIWFESFMNSAICCRAVSGISKFAAKLFIIRCALSTIFDSSTVLSNWCPNCSLIMWLNSSLLGNSLIVLRVKAPPKRGRVLHQFQYCLVSLSVNCRQASKHLPFVSFLILACLMRRVVCNAVQKPPHRTSFVLHFFFNTLEQTLC
jgi:hypothetical protein